MVISARTVILNDCSGSLVEVCEHQFQHQSYGIRTGKHRPRFEGPIWAIPDRVQRSEVAQFRLCGLTDKGSATEVWMFLAEV